MTESLAKVNDIFLTFDNSVCVFEQNQQISTEFLQNLQDWQIEYSNPLPTFRRLKPPAILEMPRWGNPKIAMGFNPSEVCSSAKHCPQPQK
ncbi:MAG: hypothetical protein LBP87_11195 [Planctomycetaceae bacterium]|jgi:hypothetical protein|nr:hypothetical protein [Planctomycetaceae bacterium]